MKVDSLKINKVFSAGGDIHYVMPHFQREYSWEKENWDTLLNDIYQLYEIYDEKNIPEHFMGALVVIEDGTRSGTIAAFKVVDGQQRLTTIALVLCALGRLAENPKKIRKLLLNEDETGDIRYKLLPTQKYDDRKTFTQLMDGKDINISQSRILTAFVYIHKQLEVKIKSGHFDPDKLHLVIVNAMHVVFINLDRQERPYEIFESLNAKGKPLTQPDLIRNYIAMMLPQPEQEERFGDWEVIENLLRESLTVARTGIGELTAFLRHYLAFRFGVLPNKDQIYARFRDRMKNEFKTIEEFASEIATLRRFAEYYNKLLRPDREEDKEISVGIRRLNFLESTTAYPLLLGMYEAVYRETMGRQDMIQGLGIIENYLVRRYMANEPTNFTNKMFPAITKNIDWHNFNYSIQSELLKRNYPTDDRIYEVFIKLPVYESRNNQRLIFLFETINARLSDGSGGVTILDGKATIEHILPQTMTPEWRRDLGLDAKKIHQEYVHTLGNLTLVNREWNSELSNKPFTEKRLLLSDHALLLNRLYFQTPPTVWSAEEIEKRGNIIIGKAIEIWPAFGSAPETQSPKNQKPELLMFRKELYIVNSWAELARKVTNCIMVWKPDECDGIFSQITFLSKEDGNRREAIGNGWWLSTGLSSESVNKLCEQLALYSGLDDDDWAISLKGD
jgi:uncharacterized protein with ParB-like and HNH nuclease domain